MTDTANLLKENKYQLNDLLITKQLQRAPKEYGATNRGPHVEIADWMINKGIKSEAELVGT